jgi:XRE family transcriptional regulator of biofilm formation
MVVFIRGEGDMIGVSIKLLRQAKGYSITDLAKQANVSKSYLSQIERGLQNNPSLQFLYKISIPLDVSINYLLGAKPDDTVQLDEEWKGLLQKAIDDGLKKEDFQEYINYIKYQTWLKKKKT